jgi:hypothetical protein
VLSGALILVGCGGSGQVSSSVGSYIGHASNAAVFIQWTRSGDSLSGSLQEAITKEGEGGGVESSSRAFAGTINGKGLTLTLHEALNSTSALVGRLSGTGFTMTWPGTQHGLISITFAPGEVAGYDAAVHALENGTGPAAAEESSSSTTGGLSTMVHGCGLVEDRQAELSVTAQDGATCEEALHVFIDLFDGEGERHQGADEAESSTDVDGWGCGTGAGGWGCRRAGEYISALTAEPKG